MTQISEEVANVLGDAEITGDQLVLVGTLDRKLYVSVNKVLDSIGGKWNRKAKAHIFDSNPEEVISDILLTGEYRDKKEDQKKFQFFETPDDIAQHLVDLACIGESDAVLEPSAGEGRIADLMPRCDVIELEAGRRAHLEDKGFNVVGDDFLNYKGPPYDVIVANPPFTNQQDIDHINHMLDLAPCVVSVACANVMWRSNKKAVAFRERIADFGGTIELLPEQSFKESGTLINTCVVHVENRKEK